MQGIAVATGAEFTNSELGMTLADAAMEQLGTCERVVVEKEKAIIVSDGAQAGAVAARIKQLGSRSRPAATTEVELQDMINEMDADSNGSSCSSKPQPSAPASASSSCSRYR